MLLFSFCSKSYLIHVLDGSLYLFFNKLLSFFWCENYKYWIFKFWILCFILTSWCFVLLFYRVILQISTIIKLLHKMKGKFWSWIIISFPFFHIPIRNYWIKANIWRAINSMLSIETIIQQWIHLLKYVCFPSYCISLIRNSCF